MRAHDELMAYFIVYDRVLYLFAFVYIEKNKKLYFSIYFCRVNPQESMCACGVLYGIM